MRIILVLVAVLILVSCASEPVAEDKRYIIKEAESCQYVKYSCNPGEEPFTDDKGCGCKTT